jgi:hypothetical protein
MMKHTVVAAVSALLLAGCGGESAKVEVKTPPELEKIVVTGAPQNALAVTAAKKDTKDGDSVVVEGRVKDFVEGRATMTIADNKLQSCKDRGEGCKTPWDYCCNSAKEIAEASAVVKVVDDAAKPVKVGLQGVKKLDHLSKVAVEGKVQRDLDGTFVIQATKVYVAE